MNSTFDSLLSALGWALVHSLWQGALAALILLILLPRLQTARQRYWAAYATLLTVLMAVMVTIFWKLEFYRSVYQSSSLFLGESPEVSSLLVENQFFRTTLTESFSQWLEANHLLIVAGWFIGFVFFLLRLGGGL